MNSPANAYNITRDWNMAQGMTSVTDEHCQIRRDLDIRHISIENSSQRQIGIAIATYYSGPTPKILFIMNGGEVKDIGINTIDGPLQWIHMLDPVTGLEVGNPYAFRHDANQFVLRDGLQKWFVAAFQKSGYRGQR